MNVKTLAIGLFLVKSAIPEISRTYKANAIQNEVFLSQCYGTHICCMLLCYKMIPPLYVVKYSFLKSMDVNIFSQTRYLLDKSSCMTSPGRYDLNRA